MAISADNAVDDARILSFASPPPPLPPFELLPLPLLPRVGHWGQHDDGLNLLLDFHEPLIRSHEVHMITRGSNIQYPRLRHLLLYEKAQIDGA